MMFKSAYISGIEAALTKLGYGGTDLRMMAMRAAHNLRAPGVAAARAARAANPLGITRGAPSVNPAHVQAREQLDKALRAIEQRAGAKVPPPVPAAALHPRATV